MASNTPAPWKFIDSPAWGYSELWNPETRQSIITTGGRNDEDNPETWMGEELSDADRALIEAAPDLLDALQGLNEIIPMIAIKYKEHLVILQVAVERARVAIAKATGAKP